MLVYVNSDAVLAQNLFQESTADAGAVEMALDGLREEQRAALQVRFF